MNPIIKLLIVLVFLVGIPAWFIGCIAGAIWLTQLLPLPNALLYPLGAIVVALAIWASVVSSQFVFKKMGLA